MEQGDLSFETRAAQAGIGAGPEDATPTVTPITASTTFTYGSVREVHEALASGSTGFAYARNANPTVAVLERALAQLEGADDVVAFGSGMAAISGALMGLGLETDDVIVASQDLYGVTRQLLTQLLNFGVRTIYVDVRDLGRVGEALRESGARALYFESISNPLLRVSDVARLAALARQHGAVSIVDNTFATPYLLRPLALGVDIVLHSATKYLGGHGDVVAGVVAAGASFATRIRDVRTVFGGVLSPFEAWLTLRGIRTLPLRMERQCASAHAIATCLAEQDWVDRVYYPGLAGDPQHALAAGLMNGRFGAMVAFDLKADQEATLRFIDHLRLIRAGTSLGDAESLVLYPLLSSHRGLSPDARLEAGIGPSLVRLSVGLEGAQDLIADLRQAARACGLAGATAPAEARPGG